MMPRDAILCGSWDEDSLPKIPIKPKSDCIQHFPIIFEPNGIWSCWQILNRDVIWSWDKRLGSNLKDRDGFEIWNRGMKNVIFMGLGHQPPFGGRFHQQNEFDRCTGLKYEI